MIRPCNFTPGTCAELRNACILVEKTETRVTNLETWQEKQNGHLSSIDGRLNRFQWFLIGIFATSAGSLLAIILGYLLQQLHR